MTPLEALQILDQATAALHAPRSDHEKITEALRTLAAVVNPPEPADG